MIHVVSLDAVTPQPWRNGGGQTRELLAWPPGSGASWLLRVSVADIERDGPFSPFPGVQRSFAVLEGAGVVLSFAEGERRLTEASDALSFDGADAPGCHLIAGPTRDLNLMARHTAGHSRMRRVQTGEACAAVPWRGVYCATPAQLTAGSVSQPLPVGSLTWSDDDTALWHLTTDDDTVLRAWWLTLENME
jgi:uncharacterized protein